MHGNAGTWNQLVMKKGNQHWMFSLRSHFGKVTSKDSGSSHLYPSKPLSIFGHGTFVGGSGFCSFRGAPEWLSAESVESFSQRFWKSLRGEARPVLTVVDFRLRFVSIFWLFSTEDVILWSCWRDLERWSRTQFAWGVNRKFNRLQSKLLTHNRLAQEIFGILDYELTL